ncbi:hypothetical protein JCM16303_005820 [Sporobolomyces ruberrimus]
MRRPNFRHLHSSGSSYQQRPPQEVPTGLKSITFGILEGRDSFSAEWERAAGGNDGVYFRQEFKGKKEAMVIEIGDQARQNRIRVSVELQHVTRIQRNSGGKSFFFHLRFPPLLEILSGSSPAPQDQTVTQVAAFDADHARVAPFASKLLRLHLRDSREIDSFLVKLQKRDLPRVISSRVETTANMRIREEVLDELSVWMRQLDLTVAFQIEKLIKNGLVDPLKLIGLTETIKDVVRVQGNKTAERILVLFADSLVRLEEIGEEKLVEIVLSDEEDGEVPETQSRKKRKLADSQPVLVVGNKTRPKPFDLELDDDDDDDDNEDEDDDVILPPEFLPVGVSAPLTPHDLTLDELTSLLRHAVNRSVVFAPLYADVDSSLLVRQITITPTSFVLGGPNLESSNSIARRYGRPEHFLRVAIRNEDGTLVDRDSTSIVLNRFKHLFRKGFEAGGRKWQFLAWASSSLKVGSCFFVSPFVKDGMLYTPEAIHRDIGNFTGDQTALIPAKYFARISQAFTSSRPSIILTPDQILHIPDLVASDGSLFSDGVGTISPGLASQVIIALGLKGTGVRPNCFQVRIGGAKGMLQVDPTLKDQTIALRPSQIKFRSALYSLSIADTFVARTGFLNRPLVKLLEDLGVPTEVFVKLQRSATEKVRKSRAKLSSAIRLLEDWNLSHSSQLSDTLKFLDQSSKTSKSAFTNPFVAQCLDAAVIHVLRGIKFKARIPLLGCYNLVGVVDISGTLEEGHIYARIQHADGKTEYLKGTMAISRSPTNHPGDVRKVTAVGKLPPGTGARIRHLTNCVVFPAKGYRSLPSMLAGGDLDGDLYLVLTESSGLLPQKVVAPAAYDAAKPTRLGRESTIEDGIDFFFQYQACDLTSLVATRQLLLADFYAQGLFHRDCLKLAQLHSDCVDYVKSGTPVLFNEIPRIPAEMQARGGRPDFASFPGEDSYRSPRALGQLYRAIDIDDIKPPGLATTSVDPRRSLTLSLLSLQLPDGSRLPSKPSRQAIDNFKAILAPFCSELRKISELCHPPAKEEELFLHVLVKHKIERSDKLLLSNRGERTDELFRLVRKEIAGKDEITKARMFRAWAAWIAAIEADEEHAKNRNGSAFAKSEYEGKFGLRSWALLALGVLSELVEKLGKEQIEVIIAD